MEEKGLERIGKIPLLYQIFRPRQVIHFSSRRLKASPQHLQKGHFHSQVSLSSSSIREVWERPRSFKLLRSCGHGPRVLALRQLPEGSSKDQAHGGETLSALMGRRAARYGAHEARAIAVVVISLRLSLPVSGNRIRILRVRF